MAGTPWIEWHGGECPVAAREGIQIQCRNETREQAEASFAETGVFYMWEHRGGTGDIIAYRVTTPCPFCDDTGDVHRIDGEWLGSCDCGAVPS